MLSEIDCERIMTSFRHTPRVSSAYPAEELTQCRYLQIQHANGSRTFF